MPSGFRLQVLESKLNGAGIKAQVDERDLYELGDAERTTVMDAMIHDGHDVPMVLVNGRIVCTNGVDIGGVILACKGAC